jgi:hypothetical protein
MKSMELTDSLREYSMKTGSAMGSELEDIITWNYLSRYFAHKLRGGLALELFRESGDVKYKDEAVSFLEDALADWLNVVKHTRYRYIPVPHVSISGEGDYQAFSWEYFIPQVEKDIRSALDAEYTPK